MKNYPLFPHNGSNTWNNWTNTYLTELNTKVCSLFDYVNYFIPDYYKGDFEDISKDQNEGEVNISLLKYREYVVVESRVFDILTKKYIEPGSRIISQAQSEGELDTPDSINRKNTSNYFIQPIGWASYYLISGKNNQLVFNYDQYAEETYGTVLRFTFEAYPRRWLLDNADASSADSAEESELEDGLVFSKDSQRYLEAVSSSEGYIIIRDKIGTEWLNSSNYPIFYFTLFYDKNIRSDDKPTTYGEEILIDSKSIKSTTFVETNKGVYTITLKKNITQWPDNGIALIY